MRSIKTVALVAATLLLVPQLAVAADLDTEVQDMKQRLEQMETQLQAQDKELAAAQEDRSATSALSSFLESTDISGFGLSFSPYCSRSTEWITALKSISNWKTVAHSPSRLLS